MPKDSESISRHHKVWVARSTSQGGGMSSLELKFVNLRNVQCQIHKMSSDQVPSKEIGSPENVTKVVFEK